MSDTKRTAELVEALTGLVPAGSVIEGNEGIEGIAEILSQVVAADFVTVMIAEQGEPTEHSGVEGFREALDDWISPYERFRLEIDEVIPLADKIVFLARQVGVTKHGGVKIETPSATVWWLRDGRITRAGFYLDRQAGLEAAGLERA